MIVDTVLKKIFGSKYERDIKALQPLADRINTLEPSISNLSNDQLKAKTAGFKQRLAQGETLEDLLPEAFAVVREAGKRVLNMRHFDVQLIGGVVLHQGKIAEMKTGEGKTLVATLPVYLNSLEGKGVHVVTVNDYLARRDSEWMGKIYKFLGLSVGVIQHDLDDEERREAYHCDVTYGTNNEFGFDYLRDNMKFDFKDCVQRGHHYAIVDEVDSILIDEARTPLIISGPVESRRRRVTRPGSRDRGDRARLPPHRRGGRRRHLERRRQRDPALGRSRRARAGARRHRLRPRQDARRPARDVAACCGSRFRAMRAIDVGRIEDRHFLNIAGFGYDVAVLEDWSTCRTSREARSTSTARSGSSAATAASSRGRGGQTIVAGAR